MTATARTGKPPRAAPPELQRVAIYVRKSTTEGLDSDFSSLDAQREACELFARSQAARGWHILPTEYSDGGRTGANTDRPGLQKLLADLERGEIDVVLTFKLDRLSRSLLDFIGLMERFQARGVSFCCVSQNFDTSTPTGRLVLHMLASFSQFERELIAERTKNKIRGSKLRGKWCGGSVPLGYDLDAGRLAVNEAEAEVVRLVFEEYLATRSLSRVGLRLNTLGHRQKLRGERGGRAWDKYSVQRILRNPIYVGLVRDGDDLHPGEHPALVTREIFDEANASLESRTTGHGPRTSRKSEFLLTGLHVTAQEADAWLAELEAGNDVEPPKCHV